ncbi:hypothetical protein BN1708_004052 [Verticillium longisporum]|uniref:cyclin-dependent kinase n=1 Tax=Verticillium longisporum TaxID=100787 RepID=A0A0G4LTW4_VERLO|nr:hypothetical protein BN1708_004052 [Verticillium longisporum]
MAGRWADTEEDAAFEAKRKQEKEEKKRLKAQKAEQQRKTEAERQKQEEALQAPSAEEHDRPSKRRKTTPEHNTADGDTQGNAKLLRFPLRSWGKCRSVEHYDKLNDIEEGTYGWVSRAKDTATGKVVALKRLKLEPTDHNGLPVTGLREIQILKDCQHRNIVSLEEVVVGDDTSKIEHIFLVLEFVEHDLKSILEEMPEPFSFASVNDPDYVPFHWKSRWFILDGWLNLVYFADVAWIAYVWRPTANNRRFAMSDEIAQDDDGTFTMADIGAPDDSDDEEAQLGKDTNPRQTLQEQLYTQPGSTTRAGQAGASASASTAPAQRNLPRESLDGETIFAVGEDGDRFSDDSDEENVKLVHSGK